MAKRNYYIIQLFLTAYFTAYLIAAAKESVIWGDILSPLGAISSFILLLIAGLKTEQPFFIWLFASLACFSYAAADILWAFYELVLRVQPNNMDIFLVLYLLPSFFVALSLYAFFVTQKSYWTNYQLTLDILAMSAALLTLIWTVFLHKQFEMLTALNIHNTLVFISLLTDFFISGCLIVLFLLLHKDKIPVIGKITFTAFVCYVLTDLAYNYLYLQNLYTPHSLIDAFFIFSLLIFAQAGLWELYKPEKPLKTNQTIGPDYSSSKLKGFILLLAPIIAILINGFNFASFLVFSIIFMAYQFLSNYIQFSINNEHLLAQEKAMNTLLEERIAERTFALQQMNQYLDILSKEDSITKLFNRRHIFDAIDSMLEKNEPAESIFILYIDLDRFKAINDSYGHDIGDQVLIEIANRLDNCNQYNGLLARVGGDEFVFVLRGQYQYDDIETIIKIIIQSCSEPIIIPPYQFQVSLSIGITQYPTDASERSELIKNADIAMYHSKSQGFNRYTFFSAIGQKIYRRSEIEIQLKKAVYDNEFELYYQPQFSILDNKLIGMEALLRWNHPEQGIIFPDDFIPIAEETGEIIPLGAWVIHQAIRQIAQWNKCYNLQLKMAINISPQQLDSVNLISHLETMISQYDIPTNWLDIEITESIAMKGEIRAEEIFAMISGLGASISIDDFGTGYSSLSYLKHYSFDRIKIDKSLIDNVTTDYSTVQIIKAIIMIGKALGIKTIAEGVEYQEQLKILAELGCDEAQGYLFSRPLPASQFEQLFLQRISSAV